jgi:hypothetical protein
MTDRASSEGADPVLLIFVERLDVDALAVIFDLEIVAPKGRHRLAFAARDHHIQFH